jgi:uncharacterized membrane protein (DUF485 family)
MYAQNRLPQQDPLTVVVLYLSRLDHTGQYSDTQLLRAMNDCFAAFGGPDELSLRYVQALRSGDAGARAHSARRAWALRVAADLALRHPGVLPAPGAPPVPVVPGTTPEDAHAPMRVARRAGDGHRRALLAGIPVVALYVLIIGSATGARGFMSLPVAGPLNVGLSLGLLQLVVVAAFVLWYGRYAATSLDTLPESAGTSAEEPGYRP